MSHYGPLKNIDKDLLQELNSLSLDYWDFKNATTKDLTHGIHTYPAVMVYPISRNLIRIIQSKQENISTLLDPFMGSGTVLVEGIISGIPEVYGTDINPLACLISRVKTKPLCIEEITTTTTQLITSVEEQYCIFKEALETVDYYIKVEKKLDIADKKATLGWGQNAASLLEEFIKTKNVALILPNFKNIGFWFLPKVILELQIIKNCIKKIENTDMRIFVWTAFSETVRLASNRRNSEFKMYRLALEKLQVFNPNTKELFFKSLNNNIEKMKAFSLQYNNRTLNPKVQILNDSATELKAIEDNSIDLMITSPPYGDSRTTVAYGEFSRLSLQWLNLEDLYEKSLSNKQITGLDKTLLGGEKADKDFSFAIDSPILEKTLNIIKTRDEERAREVYSFYTDLDQAIGCITSKMKINSYQVWVVGNRTVKKETLQTDKIIIELGKKYGLTHVCSVGRNISNKVMPSLNSPTNEPGQKVSTIINEHIVFLRKQR